MWPYLAADPDHTDELRNDLDPSPGVDLAMVKEAATETRALLDELGIEGHPKTTGRNGIDVDVRCGPSRTRSWCARRRWPWPASWSAAGPT